MRTKAEKLRKVLIVGTAVATAAGVAYAVIPSPNGVINGCYKKSGGTLRVIDPAVETCQANEVALPWNQTGLQGVPGATGAAGPPGISGYEIVSSSRVVDENFGIGGHFVLCPAGKRPLGGGAGVSEPDDDDASFFDGARVDMDFPLDAGGGILGWQAAFERQPKISNFPLVLTVYAVCANVAS
jgi:hypothetical protein